jgi:hypothetical protein
MLLSFTQQLLLAAFVNIYFLVLCDYANLLCSLWQCSCCWRLHCRPANFVFEIIVLSLREFEVHLQTSLSIVRALLSNCLFTQKLAMFLIKVHFRYSKQVTI